MTTAVVRLAGRHRASARPTWFTRAASAVGTLLLLVAGTALLATTVAPRILHFRMATMLTGSMAPGIEPGDVVIDTQENASDIAVGQIITYHVPIADHRVESHRVTWVGRDRDGAVLIRTRGDANSADDPWTARIDTAKVWRVRSVVPFAGSVIRWLRAPLVRAVLTVGAPAVLIFWLLWTIWRPAPAVDRDAARSARRQRREGGADGEAAAGGLGELERSAVRGDDAAAGVESEPAAGHVGP